MKRNVSDKQIAGIKAHAEKKNKETIEKVNRGIEKLILNKEKQINFDSVSKESGVSRATLYNNQQIKERILSLRSVEKGCSNDDGAEFKKDKLDTQNEDIANLRREIVKLKEDKMKLINQLIQLEELKDENKRLKEILRTKS